MPKIFACEISSIDVATELPEILVCGSFWGLDSKDPCKLLVVGVKKIVVAGV